MWIVIELPNSLIETALFSHLLYILENNVHGSCTSAVTEYHWQSCLSTSSRNWCLYQLILRRRMYLLVQH